MSLRIRDITKEEPGNRLFFFDANVWLLILNEIPRSSKDEDQESRRLYHRQQPYINFKNKILSNAEQTDAGGNTSIKKVIMVHSILLTELLNAHLRNSFELYKKELVKSGNYTTESVSSLSYKRHYRNQAEHYRDAFHFFQAEFFGYSPFVDVVINSPVDANILNLLSTLPLDDDFNDKYYFELCRQNKYTLVTDDGDFKEAGIEVITGNERLLKLNTNNTASTKSVKAILHNMRRGKGKRK